MPFLDLLTAERVRTGLPAASAGALIDLLAGLLTSDPVQHEEIRTALLDREALGSTGLGRGVAIPHGRLPGLEQPRAAFARLAAPLDLDSIDGAPVDLVAALVVPAHFTNQHLQLLAEMAEVFSDAALVARLREAPDSSALRSELAEFARNRPKGAAWTD
jgi:PTS system nitrogen regulatory IIA component